MTSGCRRRFWQAPRCHDHCARSARPTPWWILQPADGALAAGQAEQHSCSAAIERDCGCRWVGVKGVGCCLHRCATAAPPLTPRQSRLTMDADRQFRVRLLVRCSQLFREATIGCRVRFFREAIRWFDLIDVSPGGNGTPLAVPVAVWEIILLPFWLFIRGFRMPEATETGASNLAALPGLQAVGSDRNKSVKMTD
jgi:hypothetical protein